jgi:competence ComEA-like helix-hairpin-helix protein
MNADRLERFWLLATFLLIFIIIISAVVIRLRYDKGRPLEINSPPEATSTGNIYIEGAIVGPGLYQPSIPRSAESSQSQRIDLNHADLWLLQALPGIGEARARAIIDYRRQNGPFRDIHELTGIPGINEALFEKIKDYITVAP